MAHGPLVAVGGDYAGASVSRVPMHYVIGPDTIEALRCAEGLPNSDSAVYAKQAAFIDFLLHVAFIAVHTPRLNPMPATMPCRHPAFYHVTSLAFHVPVKSDIVAAALAYL
jgi:hypothetical protein